MKPAIILQSDYQSEAVSFLRKRLLLLFSVGAITTIIRYFVQLSTFGPTSQRTDLLSKSIQPYFDLLYLSTPIILVLGLVAVYFFGRTLTILDLIGTTILLLITLIAINGHAIFSPGSDGLFAISLVLFMFASLVPTPPILYCTVCALTVISYPAIYYVTASVIPEVSYFWSQFDGAGQLKYELIFNTSSLLVLCCVTGFVNYSLYSLRKKVGKLERMGSYQVKTVLGEGAMGIVYAAEHTLLQRPAAIKILKMDEYNEETIPRFEREVKLSSMLTHPNTITIFDYGKTEDATLYYAMELLEGIDLQDFTKKFDSMPVPRLTLLMCQVCASLHEAHSKGLVHRDIKPSNIFLTTLGGMPDFVKVLDFGLARPQKFDKDFSLTQDNDFYGTPLFASPEMIRKSADIDNRSDIYSIGVTMHYILTVKPLFPAPSLADLYSAHLNTPAEAPSLSTKTEVPKELDDIVLKCLAKDPANRYQTAEELNHALEAVPGHGSWTFDTAKKWWEIHMKDEKKCEVCDETGDLMVLSPKLSKRSFRIRRRHDTSS